MRTILKYTKSHGETTAIVDSTTGIDATKAIGLQVARSVEIGRLVACVICLHDHVALQPDVHLEQKENTNKNRKKRKW